MKKGTKSFGICAFLENGAGDEVRTHGLQLGKLTLYQLSYTRFF